jgi:hypothetical protein
MVPNRTIYIREADAELWQEAERLAGGNISRLIADALRLYVDDKDRKEQGMKSIKLDLGGIGSPRWVQFEGRWLVKPDEEDARPADPSGEAGFFYGVALTRRGNIAVYIDHVDHHGDARLETFPSLDAAAVEGVVPEEIYEMAEAAIGPDHVEELDI